MECNLRQADQVHKSNGLIWGRQWVKSVREEELESDDELTSSGKEAAVVKPVTHEVTYCE